MCLEDMFCTKINELNIFYGKTRHRQKIEFTDEIRDELKDIILEMHMLYSRRYTPKVKQNKNCSACSLKNLCLPRLTKVRSVKKYLSDMAEE